jgi:hypothetical protein
VDRALPRGLVRFVLAVLLAALLAAAVVVARDAGQEPASSRTPQVATVPPTGAPTEPDRPLPERVSPEEQAAMRAARRFLAGYLPYSYGRGSAAAIAAAAPPLLDQLRRSPPRVPPEDRTLEPRVVELEVASSNGDLGIDLTADIDDGRRRYSLTIAVRPAGDRWLVTAAS